MAHRKRYVRRRNRGVPRPHSANRTTSGRANPDGRNHRALPDARRRQSIRQGGVPDVQDPLREEVRAANQRAFVRAPASRDVLVSVRDGTIPLRRGTTVDIGRNGLGIEAAGKIPLAATVDIEMLPRAETDSSSPLFLAGQIVWAKHGSGGTFRFGIHTSPPAPSLGSFTRKRAGTGSEIPPPPTPSAAPSPLSPTSRKKRSSGDSPMRYLWLPLLLLLLLLLAWPYGGPRRSQAASRLPAPSKTAKALGDEGPTGTTQSVFRNLTTRWPQNANLIHSPLEDPASRGGRLQRVPDAGENLLSLSSRAPQDPWSPSRPKDSEHPGVPDRLAAWPPTAKPEAAGARRNRGTTGRLGAALEPGTGEGAAQGAPEHGRKRSAGPGKASPHSAASGGNELTIWVDKRRFQLALYDGNSLVAAYPIGIGAEDSTPSGRFHIANKLFEPTYHGQGGPVPPNDERNPLGKHWLGLGNAQGATEIGFHATPNASSIGQAQSRGCIRMRPEDAEDLFQQCPVGTPVTICP